MLSAWLLPEHIADVLPAQASHIERLRRRLLDCAQSYGFELVIPPLLEHVESLLSGNSGCSGYSSTSGNGSGAGNGRSGSGLDLRTFKLVDQASGRQLGLRADTTIQAARIDAHLLNHKGVTRLCYCGPVLHARAAGVAASREPLQFGAEIFGHAGLEADLEAAELALDCLRLANVQPLVIDLAHTGLLSAIVKSEDGAMASGNAPTRGHDAALAEALARKDISALAVLCADKPATVRQALANLVQLYGGQDTLAQARAVLPPSLGVSQALDQLEWLAARLRATFPQLQVGFDLADMSGYAYYSGARFAVYGAKASEALARGGRYDEVGAAFGRNRPAVGFSVDLKALAELSVAPAPRAAIRAVWSEDPAQAAAVRRLREQGQAVCVQWSGAAAEHEAFACDRELAHVAGQWVLQSLS